MVDIRRFSWEARPACPIFFTFVNMNESTVDISKFNARGATAPSPFRNN